MKFREMRKASFQVASGFKSLTANKLAVNPLIDIRNKNTRYENATHWFQG